MDNRIYWIWLAEQCGYASKYFTLLYSLYRNPVDVYELENDEVMQFDKRFPDAFKDRLCRRDLSKARAIFDYCESRGIEVLPFGDKRYPERLRLIEDPPVVLYCLGEAPDFNDKLYIGIVGTRKMSRYGRASAYRFAYELSAMGACVVSGLALGVDATAACGAIEGGSPTVQVLGCGVDVVYPKTHSRLRNEVIKKGVLISEYPPLEEPKQYYFPQRNRIISGMSHGVFVAECRRESGAMITAKLALGQGRDIFALPGNVGEPTAEGPNELLRIGANASISVEDITSHYKLYFNDDTKKEDAERLRRARAEMPDVLSVLSKYSIPDRCEENERINSAPLVGSRSEAGYSPRKAQDVSERGEVKFKKTYEEPQKAQKTEEAEPEDVASSTAKDYGLDEKTAKIFAAIPCKSPISVDRLVGDGITAQDAVTALTMLEIMGLVSSLPGGLYIRA